MLYSIAMHIIEYHIVYNNACISIFINYNYMPYMACKNYHYFFSFIVSCQIFCVY